MSTEILIALTALAGTLLGATLNGLSKFFDTWWIQKARKKEKHEKIVRIILVELLPDIKFLIDYSETYEQITSLEWKEKNINWCNRAISVYKTKIKNDIPLDMIEMMSNFNSSIEHLKYIIETDDPSLIVVYDGLNRRTKELIEDIEKKINTDYK